MNHSQLVRLALAAAWVVFTFPSGAEVSFRNEIMPLLSKAGCNSGGCHGNANGKASFKLSLRGEDAQFDYLALTRDQFGRRVDLAEPEGSLLLLKASTAIAHEGGERFKKSSLEYELLKRWIAAGAKDDVATAPKLTAISVTPTERVISEPLRTAKITATARFSDGQTKDITSVAAYEPSDPSVSVSPDGRVESAAPGEVTVLVRFLDKQLPVRLAFIPARADFKWSKPRENNLIDRHIFAKLKNLRINPADLCADELFLRRAYLDLLGILPTAQEAKAFVARKDSRKRAKLVDDLLEREEFADFWALKWSDLLRNEERLMDRKGVETFHRWVRQSILEKKPLDQFARELISARGSTYLNPAANYYRGNRDPVSRAEAAAQVFLGTRLQCAQCHSHPFDRWTQDDYYDWTGLFARIDYKVLENRRRDDNDKHEFKGEQVVYLKSKFDFKNPKTDALAKPRFLGSNHELSRDEDELDALAAWMTDPKNPFFAKAQVNRIWFHLMGRGLVDPLDDFRATNPASHSELLEELAREFVKNKYDMRHIVRLIMNSRAYQLSSTPADQASGGMAANNFAHAIVRRLTAEQLLDAQSHLAGAPAKFEGYPAGTRATQLPGALSEQRRGRGRLDVDQFMAEFGKPARLLPSECERSCEPTMAQAFQLISGPAVNELLTRKENRLAAILNKPNPEIIDELFWTALTRAPLKTESDRFNELLANSKNKRATVEDLAWSLANSKEFLFRR